MKTEEAQKEGSGTSGDQMSMTRRKKDTKEKVERQEN